jgi:hypothetical protein
MANNSIHSGEAYLACWMVRVGLTVNPMHVVCKHLTKSLMARIFYISNDMQSMRVDYPSEPMLAFAARRIILERENDLLCYYEKLEYYLHARAIDYGRMSEIVYGDILLQAVANSNRIEMKTWKYVTGLPSICAKQSFLSKDSTQTRHDPSVKEGDSPTIVRNAFEKFDTTITVHSFIETLFGRDLLNYIPLLISFALMNGSHFVQMSRNFPASACNIESMKGPVADVRFESCTTPCDIMTQENLLMALTRTNFFMAPPNSFGIDIMVPCCLNPDLVFGRQVDDRYMPKIAKAGIFNDTCNADFDIRGQLKSIYTAILCQIKKSTNYGNVRTIVANCAQSNHLVRCAVHQCCSPACIHRPIAKKCSKHKDEKNPCSSTCESRPQNITCKFHTNCNMFNCCLKHENCHENCNNRIPDEAYAQILGNGVALLHVMEAKSFSQREDVIEINNSALWTHRSNIFSNADNESNDAQEKATMKSPATNGEEKVGKTSVESKPNKKSGKCVENESGDSKEKTTMKSFGTETEEKVCKNSGATKRNKQSRKNVENASDNSKEKVTMKSPATETEEKVGKTSVESKSNKKPRKNVENESDNSKEKATMKSPGSEIEEHAIKMFENANDETEVQDSHNLEYAKKLIEDLCPQVYQNIFANCKTKKKWSKTLDSDIRFIPDIYIAKVLGPFLKVHFMAKLHLDTGIIERLTVIESRGLQVFENFFPKNVADIANRIIFDEISVFDELGKEKNTIKYRELIQSVVHTNNDSRIPHANNCVREMLGKTEISDVIPNYGDVEPWTIDHQLR